MVIIHVDDKYVLAIKHDFTNIKKYYDLYDFVGSDVMVFPGGIIPVMKHTPKAPACTPGRKRRQDAVQSAC